MLNKTAIQKAIEDVKFLEDKASDVISKIAYGMAISVIELQKETEKKQIISAVDYGIEAEAGVVERDYKQSAGQQYFKETFNP